MQIAAAAGFCHEREERRVRRFAMSRVTHLHLPAPRRRRFMISLPEATWSQLNQLAAQLGQSPPDVFQAALELLEVAADEATRGHVLAIATRDGKILKQIVIRT
jgi:hypothetical protein